MSQCLPTDKRNEIKENKMMFAKKNDVHPMIVSIDTAISDSFSAGYLLHRKYCQHAFDLRV